jgi:mRNA interferase RelE/StbE
MAYDIFLKRSAEQELLGLPAKIHDKAIEGIISLKENPRPAGVIRLQGREGYRLRVGDYRILYLVDDREKKIEIFSVAHRKEVYR